MTLISNISRFERLIKSLTYNVSSSYFQSWKYNKFPFQEKESWKDSVKVHENISKSKYFLKSRSNCSVYQYLNVRVILVVISTILILSGRRVRIRVFWLFIVSSDVLKCDVHCLRVQYWSRGFPPYQMLLILLKWELHIKDLKYLKIFFLIIKTFIGSWSLKDFIWRS